MQAGAGGNLSESCKKKVAAASNQASTFKMTAPAVNLQKSMEVRGEAEAVARGEQQKLNSSQHKEGMDLQRELSSAALNAIREMHSESLATLKEIFLNLPRDPAGGVSSSGDPPGNGGGGSSG